MHYNARLLFSLAFWLEKQQKETSPRRADTLSNPIRMAVYTSFAAFLFFSIALIVPSGFSAGPVLLILGSVGLVRRHLRANRKTLDRQDWTMAGVLGAYFLICSLMNALHGAPGREYDAPLRFLFAIPALLLLLKFPPAPAAVWSGLGLGAIGSGLFAGWQNLTLAIRAEGFTNPIQYGNISCLLGVLCLAGLGWAGRQRHAKRWIALLATGAVFGVLGAIFTGSRGSWVGLPLCLAVLYKYYGASLRKRHIVFGMLAVVLGLAVLYAVPRSEVRERIELAVTEANGYVDKHDARTSTGARLEMWRAGVMLLKEKPLLGWGKKGYMDRIVQLVEAGKVDPIATEHSHLHNEYLDAWVKRGIPGLIAVLILYFVPLWLFLVQYRNGNDASRPYSAAGLMLGLSYLAYGLTQAFLTHNNGVMLYAFTLAILWAMSRNYAGQLQQPQSSP